MDGDIFQLVSSFRIASRKLRVSDSDYVDILNHHFFPLIFCFFSIAICAKQYLIGDPLQCWVPKEYSGAWEQYAENYCWVENTYFVRSNETVKSNKKVEIYYYQWVPFVLILQALMFYLPHYFWRMTNWMSGVDIRYLMRVALDTTTGNAIQSSQSIQKMVEHFQEFFLEPIGTKFIIRKRIYLCVCYSIVKITYIANSILQFWIISSFLNLNFSTFGLRILSEFNNNIFWDKTGVFPRVTFCHFDIRTIDDSHHHTVQCVLVVNLIIEKFYIAIWFLLAFLFIFNSLNFLRWMIWMTCKRKAVQSIHGEKIWDNMNADSLFVLRLLKKNCLGVNYNTFIKKFDEQTKLYDGEEEMGTMI